MTSRLAIAMQRRPGVEKIHHHFIHLWSFARDPVKFVRTREKAAVKECIFISAIRQTKDGPSLAKIKIKYKIKPFFWFWFCFFAFLFHFVLCF